MRAGGCSLLLLLLARRASAAASAFLLRAAWSSAADCVTPRPAEVPMLVLPTPTLLLLPPPLAPLAPLAPAAACCWWCWVGQSWAGDKLEEPLLLLNAVAVRAGCGGETKALPPLPFRTWTFVFFSSFKNKIYFLKNRICQKQYVNDRVSELNYVRWEVVGRLEEEGEQKGRFFLKKEKSLHTGNNNSGRKERNKNNKKHAVLRTRSPFAMPTEATVAAPSSARGVEPFKDTAKALINSIALLCCVVLC